MVYRAIGLMSGSSLDGLDIVFVTFEEIRGEWSFSVNNAETIEFTDVWRERLSQASQLNALDFVQLDNDFGRFIAKQINLFIEKNQLDHQIQMIASHGHTIFHDPEKFLTTQIGNAAQIAALTSTNVISNLRSLDVALGGQGAPIVPIGEKFLFNNYNCFLNLGGIANVSIHENENVEAFDICVANQALNYFAEQLGSTFDKDGHLAALGNVNTELLSELNNLAYYKQRAPKSLSNQYFKEEILAHVDSFHLNPEDLLHTYSEHIAIQIVDALKSPSDNNQRQLFVTGGGAYNVFLIDRLKDLLSAHQIEVIIPDDKIVQYKEALIMAFLGILRWREENTVMANTGAQWPSIGGAVWIGQKY